MVPQGLVLGREGARVGVRRVPSVARGDVAAEQVARGRAVVFEFIGVPGGFWSQSGRKKPKKISFFSFFFLSLFRGQATNRENNNTSRASNAMEFFLRGSKLFFWAITQFGFVRFCEVYARGGDPVSEKLQDAANRFI